MRNVLIIGASGNIARRVTHMLIERKYIRLTLFLRNRRRLGNNDLSGCKIVEGNALNYDQLRDVVVGQDIVYINLAGDLEAMAKNIVQAMKETDVRRVILVSSIGIYDEPLRPVLKPYRAAADVIENAGLDYTVLRPTWFTDVDEVDYEITHKGQPEKGSVISQKSLASFIVRIIENPEQFIGESLGINKPN
ncbi:MAG: NAD(P)H-binding protein [Chitinophagaceae bacterium]|nr:NAD(P)H-binding protein [Chitinophagaceae bacterium]